MHKLNFEQKNDIKKKVHLTLFSSIFIARYESEGFFRFDQLINSIECFVVVFFIKIFLSLQARVQRSILHAICTCTYIFSNTKSKI